ncbi:MAG TPA: DNA replication/repair protein RecF [Steroidobacteraceae bacterium]|nr:DNA replication/repair protein RecF [Steroidobacteraceae bacterium]
MSLRHFEVRDFRCIASAELEFDGRCNLISGPNASGKTSLLEAVFFLGRGRSFRTPRNETLIRKGARELLVAGRLSLTTGGGRPVGIRYGRDGFEARAGGHRIGGLAELATVLPVQAIDPEVHRLVEEGPQERRRFLDWGVFHVEPGFVDRWRRYQRALRQRNAALKAGSTDAEVRAWDPELIEAGQALAASRRDYFESLQPAVAATGERLLGVPVTLSLSDGWAHGVNLATAVEEAWPRDRERGITHAGPHRADLGIRVGADLPRHHVSRGQQKLTAAAMLLGQLQCDASLGSPTSALLVDDPAAELDASNLERLVSLIVELPAQLFVTALDPFVTAFESLPTAQRFHVEHGKFTRLI